MTSRRSSLGPTRKSLPAIISNSKVNGSIETLAKPLNIDTACQTTLVIPTSRDASTTCSDLTSPIDCCSQTEAPPLHAESTCQTDPPPSYVHCQVQTDPIPVIII